MKVVKARQIFRWNSNNNPHFSHSEIVYCSDGQYYSATSKERKIDAGQLEDIRPIPIETYQPIAPPDSITVYTKTPNLTGFGGDDSAARRVLQELRTCESIHKNPHANITTYYGCFLEANRITGLCFMYCPSSLMTLVNPTYLNKTMLISDKDREPSREQAIPHLVGIEAGIRHLHGLGIIHNDINPANILITKDNIPVVSDFDSSSPPHVDISCFKRTHGWYDPDVSVAAAENDMNALKELRIWLTGSSAEEFLFPKD